MRKSRGMNFLLGAVTLAVFLLFLFPFAWMLLGSLKTPLQIMSFEHAFVFTPTLKNYVNVFVTNDFLRFMVNSLIVACGATLLSLALGIPAAYAIARNGMRRLAEIVLVVRMIPPVTFLIPWFIVFSKLKMADTFLSLILVNMVVVLPFVIWVMISYFESNPLEMEEAGMIDGCSRTQIFLRLVLPISVPGIVTASLLSFIFTWNNFLFSVVFAGDKTKTLPLAVFNFMSYASIDWGALMAAALVITTPILAIAVILHRYIVSGLSAGVGK